MENKIFNKTTKTTAILLVFCFLLSVTVTSVNAAAFEDKYGQGYKDGYIKGSNDGKKDCNQYGNKDILKKMPDPSDKDKSYGKGFILGYNTGYNEQRYSCLQKVLMLTKGAHA
jgi:hypothetical protein